MEEFEVIIIGGGPGGYAAAVRSSESGLKTALIEKEKLGGVCVNHGCTPTKTMLRYAGFVNQKALSKTYDFLYENIPEDYRTAHTRSFEIAERQGKRIKGILEKSRVVVFRGNARLTGRTKVEIQPSGKRIFGKNIIIATGSSASQIAGVEYDEKNIVTYRGALGFDEAPSSAVVIGSGATGVEFATLWNRFGSKVTILEIMHSILPKEDEDVSTEAEVQLKKADVQIRTGVKVESIACGKGGVEVAFTQGEAPEKLIVDKVLISAGITPNTCDLGLEELGIKTNHGFIEINEMMQTNVSGIYAVGDVTGKLALATAASFQAAAAAQAIAGQIPQELIYENIPRCIYCAPEVASVGLTEKQSRERGYDVISVQKPVSSDIKMMPLPENIGFKKMVVDAKSRKLLGAHIVGNKADSLIGSQSSIIASGAVIPEQDTNGR